MRSLTPGESRLQLSIGISLGRAFHGEPNFVYMVPSPLRRRRGLPWFFGSFVVRIGLRRGVVDVAADGSAAAIWIKPGTRVGARDALAAGLPRLPFRLGARGAWRSMVLSSAIEKERSSRMDEPHWYLMALGVAPEKQGRGIGSALLARGLARADGSGSPAYLETFRERTARLYARRGFEVVGRAKVGRTGPTFTTMARHPGG